MLFPDLPPTRANLEQVNIIDVQFGQIWLLVADLKTNGVIDFGESASAFHGLDSLDGAPLVVALMTAVTGRSFTPVSKEEWPEDIIRLAVYVRDDVTSEVVEAFFTAVDETEDPSGI